MGTRLTDQQKMDMATKGYTEPEELPDATGPRKGLYHDRQTGREIYNLPIDPYSIVHYRRRGLVLGPAPAELKAQWEARPKRQAELENYIPESNEDSSLISLVLEMKKEIAELKHQLEKPKLNDDPVEFTQLKLL